MKVETLFMYIKLCNFAESKPSFNGLKRFDRLMRGMV